MIAPSSTMYGTHTKWAVRGDDTTVKVGSYSTAVVKRSRNVLENEVLNPWNDVTAHEGRS